LPRRNTERWRHAGAIRQQQEVGRMVNHPPLRAFLVVETLAFVVAALA
jgi:hypothetical protein